MLRMLSSRVEPLWSMAEVPGGIISNIRKSQYYGPHRVVLRKSGMSDGMQEIFTFTRERDAWRLTRYEN